MTADRTAHDWLSWLPAIGVVMVPAIVVPNVLWAHYAFHQRHPDADPSTYLTISRAISDPAIGEPFAVWVTLAAGILWFSTHYILWMFVAQHPDRSETGIARDRIARVLWGAMSLSMTATSIGMVMLSHYRLGGGADQHRLHMIGSYLFFGSQTTTIFLVAVYHSTIATARRAAFSTAFFSDRWRSRAGYAVVLAAVLYGVVYQVKSMDLGATTRYVVSFYVQLETVLIIAFLAYLAGFSIDTHRFARSGRDRAKTSPRAEAPISKIGS